MRTEHQFRYDFDKADKIFGRLFKGALVLWALGVLGSLVLLAGGLYVALHFIAKWW